MHARSVLASLALAIAVSAHAALLDPPDFTLRGVPCTLIPVPAMALPISTGTCPGVRPGGVVLSAIGQCTLNFLFQGSDGRRYIGTAGHCVLAPGPIGGQVEAVWGAGMGPVAMDSNGGRIGEFAYAVLADPKDFSLIRLDPQVPATPAMCAFRGPTGINSDQPEITQIVMLNYYGSGIGLGSTFPARSALTVGMPNPDYVFAEGVAVPGDSGSGVMSSDGRAVGVLVATGVHKGSVSTSGAGAGTMGITRLQPQLDRAQTALGIFFTLQLAPLQ